MFLSSILSRLNLNHVTKFSRSIHSSNALFINISPILYAEPLKKKKKIDPAIIKQREERRKKKLEKQIRRLEKNARQLKPIDELEVPFELIDQKAQRTRVLPEITQDVLEKRANLLKEWARYKHNERTVDLLLIDRVFQAQQKALEELRKESEELYQEAIQKDIKLVPFTAKGPVSTPPIPNYDSPDGEYIDISKKWE